MARWCALFSEECRRRGIRLTPQRLAIYRALACDATHPAADGIYAALREEVSGLSRATVYRMLESLQREGFVRRVSTVDGIARFDANLAPHQHLVCRRCRSILDTGGEWLRPPELPRRGPAGFIPEILDICIIGICARCRRRGGGAGTQTKYRLNQARDPRTTIKRRTEWHSSKVRKLTQI